MRYGGLCIFALAVGFFTHGMANETIRIETFKGNEIAPHIQGIVKLCDRIYREPPYLYNGDDADYTDYIESYSQVNEAIICLAFDGKEAIGLGIGTPMLKTREFYQQTLIEHGYDLSQLFYLGEFGLKPGYHGLGIEETILLEIENFAKKTGAFSAMCIWELDNSKHEILKKMGFIRHAELNFQIFWTNIGDELESAHLAVYSTLKI